MSLRTTIEAFDFCMFDLEITGMIPFLPDAENLTNPAPK